jgi:hypothetical protein
VDPTGQHLCSIVKCIEWTGEAIEGVTIDGSTIVFPGFGTIHVGELLVMNGRYRASLLRLMLGSPEGGEIIVCEGDGDGHGWPP